MESLAATALQYNPKRLLSICHWILSPGIGYESSSMYTTLERSEKLIC